MSDNIAGDLRKLMMAGLGAAATLTEKSAKLIDDLSKKGEEKSKDIQPALDDLAKKGGEALEKGRVFSEEVGKKLSRAFDDCAQRVQQMDIDDVRSSLDGLTDDALGQLKAHLDDLIERRGRGEAGCCGGDGCGDAAECCGGEDHAE